jgi:hypothetical protein
VKKVKSKKKDGEYLFCDLCPHFRTAHGPRGCNVKDCECREKSKINQ